MIMLTQIRTRVCIGAHAHVPMHPDAYTEVCQQSHKETTKHSRVHTVGSHALCIHDCLQATHKLILPCTAESVEPVHTGMRMYMSMCAYTCSHMPCTFADGITHVQACLLPALNHAHVYIHTQSILVLGQLCLLHSYLCVPIRAPHEHA